MTSFTPITKFTLSFFQNQNPTISDPLTFSTRPTSSDIPAHLEHISLRANSLSPIFTSISVIPFLLPQLAKLAHKYIRPHPPAHFSRFIPSCKSRLNERTSEQRRRCRPSNLHLVDALAAADFSLMHDFCMAIVAAACKRPARVPC